MPKENKIPNKPTHVRCVWGLVCSLSSIDQQRNNLSLFNVIDQLNIPIAFKKQAEVDKTEVIEIGFEHEIVFLLRRTLTAELCSDPLVLDMKLSLIDPAGKVLTELLRPLEFKAGNRVLRYRVQNNGFRLSCGGDYVYRAEISGQGSNKFELVAEVPFYVHFI
jgi:hypothetical protein